jgi:hypothetical protein
MMTTEVEMLRSATKLKVFLIGQGNALIRVLTTVSWRDVLWFLLGWVLMLLIPPEEEAPTPPPERSQTKAPARRRNGCT